METTINLLVIGCGRIGKMHVDNIITNFDDVTIVGIIDEKCDPKWAQARGLSLHKKDQLDTLLQNPCLHCVLIATSSSEHVKLITAAAKAGKHIFCEKPISFDINTLDDVINLIDAQGIQCQVGLNRRFDADFQRVKQVVASGDIGIPYIIKITNRDPKRPDLNFIPRSGGLFLDFSIHDFDMARFILNTDISEIFAMGATLIDPKIAELGDIDTAVISLKMSNGALCIIDCSRETHYGYDQRIEVLGSKGKIAAQNLQPTNVQLTNSEGVHSDILFL